jgi:hypothetical protein
MADTAAVDALDDRGVLLILQDLTVSLEDRLPAERTVAVQSEEEARLAIASLLRDTGQAPAVDLASIVPDEAEAARLGRKLLELSLQDPDTQQVAEALVRQPPADEQMDFGATLGAAIVLGALITWLQTKVRLRVRRAQGKTEFDFEVNKDKTDPAVIKSVAETVGKLLA